MIAKSMFSADFENDYVPQTGSKDTSSTSSVMLPTSKSPGKNLFIHHTLDLDCTKVSKFEFLFAQQMDCIYLTLLVKAIQTSRNIAFEKVQEIERQICKNSTNGLKVNRKILNMYFHLTCYSNDCFTFNSIRFLVQPTLQSLLPLQSCLKRATLL